MIIQLCFRPVKFQLSIPQHCDNSSLARGLFDDPQKSDPGLNRTGVLEGNKLLDQLDAYTLVHVMTERYTVYLTKLHVLNTTNVTKFLCEITLPINKLSSAA